MFRIPYRWTARPLANIKWIIDDIFIGVKNVIRWTPVIWYDADFDWDYLAHVMEYKLRRMSKRFRQADIHTNSQKIAADCLLCAELLKRLRADDYAENAQLRFGRTSAAYRHSSQVQKNDMRYLGLILGKYLNHWWD